MAAEHFVVVIGTADEDEEVLGAVEGEGEGEGNRSAPGAHS